MGQVLFIAYCTTWDLVGHHTSLPDSDDQHTLSLRKPCNLANHVTHHLIMPLDNYFTFAYFEYSVLYHRTLMTATIVHCTTCALVPDVINCTDPPTNLNYVFKKQMFQHLLDNSLLLHVCIPTYACVLLYLYVTRMCSSGRDKHLCPTV